MDNFRSAVSYKPWVIWHYSRMLRRMTAMGPYKSKREAQAEKDRLIALGLLSRAYVDKRPAS
jgi:hypothetical protein